MGLVDWNNVDPKPQTAGNNKDNYLRLEAGKKYRIRPCGKPLEVNRYYIPDATGKTRSAITEDPKTCIIHQKYPTQTAKLRYAIKVIDRADNKVKILEAPPSVFRPMREWAEATGKDPGGIDGADFAITVEVPSGGDKRRTVYKTMALVPTMLSEEEVTMVKGSQPKLAEIYKATPQDKIEAVLFGPAPASGGTSNGQAPTTASAPRPAAQVAADDDIGF